VKTIDLENHFATESWLEALEANPGYPTYAGEEKGIGFSADTWMPLRVKPKLLDLDEGRMELMDEAGVDYAVLSLAAPGCEQLDVEVAKRVAKESNDILAAAIRRHPDRFGGFAALVPKDPEWSADELERCVKELGFRGWNTHSNFGDSYIDEKQYWPLLAKVEELNVPIYLHPTVPIIPELNTFGMVLGGPTFGFGVEVAYAFMRMIVRGVFDEFPNLKIIMGHYGEALPFLVNRVDRAYMQKHSTPNPDRSRQQGMGQLLPQEQPVGDDQR
jgi:predicted TIM-barrel fold metal-dependent hydrolase